MRNNLILFFLFFITAASICALIWVVFRIRASSARVRKNSLKVTVIALFFSLIDWALLAVLPMLGLSFGPIAFSLICWVLVRIVICLSWIIFFELFQGSKKHDDNGHTKRAARQRIYLVIQICLVLLMFYGFYIEPFRLTITRLQFPVNHTLPQQHLRIVHLSDFHIERLTKRELDILEKLESLKPDIIILTGDYLNLSYVDDPITHQQTRSLLSQLYAPMGVYAVNGTVEKGERMNFLFDELENITAMDNTLIRPLEDVDLYLLGISNHVWQRDRESLLAAAPLIPEDSLTVMLYHTPDLIETASQLGVDLYFAGHTHGGQVRLPIYGALITLSKFGKKYEQGLYSIGPMTAYISRGIGMEGAFAPRVRFLCPPEITVIDLESNG
jgi:predicted MPP superfamily phosphohydrolase